MWHQSPPASHVDNAELVSDCPPGRRQQFPHGVLPNQGGVAYTEEQLWKSGKERDGSYMKGGYHESGKCLYDSGRTDSGFLSGANIVSEQGLSSDDISSPSSRKFTDSSIQEDCKENTQSLMRLDSGVDVNEQFSSLSLTSTNDLNATPSKSHSQDSGSTTTFTNINVPASPTSKAAPPPAASVHQPQTPRRPVAAVQPWELYYQQDEDGDTQLHIAIIQEFIEVVYSLIQMAPHPCLLDIHNYDCQTPLHLAVLTRQPRIVRRLIVAGATVDLRDRVGNTALHLACQAGDFDCVRALTEPVTVAETADANLRYHAYSHQVPQNLEEKNYDGLMCVHLAALSGNVDVLRHLVWFGANVNAKDGKSGRTPLHLSVELGLRNVALFLVEELSAALQLEAATYAGLTAYQLAAAADHALARTLQQRGALPRPPPEDEEDDEDSEDEEMYRLPSEGSFSVNGQPLDIGA